MSELLNGIPRHELVRSAWWRRRRWEQVGWYRRPLTERELQEWSAFEILYGPLLVHERVEVASAIAAAASARIAGASSVRVADFLPAWGPADATPAEELTEEQEAMLARIRSIRSKWE